MFTLGGVFFDQKGRRSGTWKAIVRQPGAVTYVPLDHTIGPGDRSGAEKAARRLLAERNRSLVLA